MIGSLLKIASDVTTTAVEVTAAVTTPFVDLASDAIAAAADEMILSPTSDLVQDLCDSIKDAVKD
ncbi:hypothetical protein K5Y72_002987 [Escherichia coli]|nr:hypothetical protein [Escherichia coli]